MTHINFAERTMMQLVRVNKTGFSINIRGNEFAISALIVMH